MSMYGSCALCGKELFEADAYNVHIQIVGWERRTRKKGVMLKRETGAIAHGSCIDEAKSKQKVGVPITQRGLF